MKKILFVGLALVLFTACQNQEQRYFDESTEIETIHQLFKNLQDANFDDVRTIYNDTAKIHVNSLTPISIDESISYEKESRELFSMYTFKDSIYPEMVVTKKGQTWVNTWPTWVGKVQGHDKEITIPGHATYRFENGKIVEEYVYYDSAPLTAIMAELEKANNLPIEDKVIYGQVDTFINEFLNKKNTAVLDDLINDKYVRYMNDVKDAGSKEELVSNLNVFFTGFPDFKIKLLHKSPIFNNTLFVHWQMTGTNTGEFNGAAATGKSVKVNGLSRLHFTGNGKLDEENLFYDQLNLMTQLGYTLN
ncbi:ester cyclase [Geojedonia litorea]|uniref:Ester cyclase n=1 Tax=Geojedonia litorea TaxID=1268269 RepID=A0ABV9N8N4_9FLAO